MSNTIYAGQPDQFTSNFVSLDVANGGTVTETVTYYYWFQGLTRGGLNYQTALGQLSVNAGQKLTLSLAESIPDGADTLAIALSANTINDTETAKLMGILFLKESDQETLKTSPSLEFTSDDHFALSDNVTSFSDLGGIDAVTGNVRFVLDESAYYLYDSEGWFPELENNAGWLNVNGNLTYIDDITESRKLYHLYGGSYCPIPDIEPNSIVNLPFGWTKTGDESPSIKLWFLNGFTEGSGNILTTGNRLYLIPYLNGSTELGSAKFSQATEITPTSLIRLLDNTIESSLSNAPILYTSGIPFYTLDIEVSQGYAIELNLKTTASLLFTDSFYFDVVNYGNFGVLDNNDFLGSVVFPENTVNPNASKFARILPDGIGLKRLKGQGRISLTNEVGGYLFNNLTDELILGIPEPNTNNQIVAISGILNGKCRIIQSESDLLVNEKIRAIIGTESGYQYPSEWSNTITLTSNKRIEIIANWVNSIRSNYPDVIAGMTDAVFQVDGIIVELRKDDNISYIFPSVVPSTSPQIILLDSIDGLTTTLPTTKTDLDFGLFDYEPITITQGIVSGLLPAGDYKVRLYYHYSGVAVSRISHAVTDGCIPENLQTLSDVVSQGSYWKTPVATKTALKALSVDNLTLGEVRVVLEEDAPYIFKNSLPWPADGENYLESDDGTGQGWIKAGGQSSGGTGGISDGDKGDIVVSSNGAVFTIDANTITTGKLQNDSITESKIINSAITNAKLANTSQNTVKGRVSAGTGTVEDLTGTQITTLLDTFTTNLKGLVPPPTSNVSAKLLSGAGWLELSLNKGSLLVSNGLNLASLPVGSNNQILIADSTNPNGLAWVDNNASISTTTSVSYIQPSLNSSVTVTVGTTANMIVDGYIDIAIGGYYKVVTINSATSVIIQYLGNGVTTGTSISSGKRVIPSGKAGTNGLSAITYTSASFIVPAINSTVDISIPDSTIFNPEIYVNIEGAGSFFLTEIVNSTTIRAKNLGGDNVPESTNILANSKIIISGAKGNTGSILAFGKTDTPNNLLSTEAALRVNTSDEVYIDLELTQKKLTFWDSVKDALLTGFTEGTLSAIAATDTIIQALSKVQKYLTDYLTTFNTANKLVQLDGTGKIPAIDGSLITNIPYPVTTVNSKSGVVALDADDIDDTSTTNKFVTQSDLDKIANVPANTNTELGNKQDTLVSGTTIKTINSQSLLGSGDITITGGSGGHTIQDEGTPLTARTNLDFVGSGVTVTDDSVNDKTIVTITGSGTAAVESVNGLTGTVVLDADDIDDTSTVNKFVNSDHLLLLNNLKVLTANVTYYVREDGNNSNTGLSDDSVGAFRSIQYACDIISHLYLNGYDVTLQITGDHTAEGIITIVKPDGTGNYYFKGVTVDDVGADFGINWQTTINGISLTNQHKCNLEINNICIKANLSSTIYLIYSINSQVKLGERIRLMQSNISSYFMCVVSANSFLLSNPTSSVYIKKEYPNTFCFLLLDSSIGNIQFLQLTLLTTPTFTQIFFMDRLSYCSFGGGMISGAYTGAKLVVQKNASFRNENWTYTDVS